MGAKWRKKIKTKWNIVEEHYGETPYGHLSVESRSFRPLHQYFVDAGKEMGLKELDLNGPQREGVAFEAILIFYFQSMAHA